MTNEWQPKIDFLITLLMLAVVTLVGWRAVVGVKGDAPIAAELPTGPVSLEGVHLQGKTTAGVAILLYVDYACTACQRLESDIVQDLIRTYVATGKVLLGIQPFPLRRRGEAALEEAGLAECARRQQRFPDAHRILFNHASASFDTKVKAVSEAASVPPELLRSCVHDVRHEIVTRVESARRLGIRGTPTILVGRNHEGRLMSVQTTHRGVAPGDQWIRRVIDPALATVGQ